MLGEPRAHRELGKHRVLCMEKWENREYFENRVCMENWDNTEYLEDRDCIDNGEIMSWGVMNCSAFIFTGFFGTSIPTSFN